MAPPTKRRPATKQRTSQRSKSSKARSLAAGEWFERLVAVQKRLRAPDGCPWDREQTHATLRPYLIEEAYEVLDALESGDDQKFADELGDLLIQVVFHSEIAAEQRRFTVADVIRAIHDKMIRRHPHVFGEARAKNSAEVLRNWERIKAEERLNSGQGSGGNSDNTAAGNGSAKSETPPSLLDGVSRGLPAMLQGLQLTRKAARAGFDWHNADGIFEKLREEMAEVRHALAENNAFQAEEELGDLLFAAVNLARFVQVDPEIALKRANAKFQRRFARMEKSALEGGQSFADLPRESMEALWDAVKHQEARPAPGRDAEPANGAPKNNGTPKNKSSRSAAAHSR